MSDRQPHHDRDAERHEVGAEDGVESEPAIGRCPATIGELTDGHAGDAGEHARESEMREHPVDAIEILVDVLEEENGAAKIGGVARADERLQERQIATHEAALRAAGRERDHASVLRE